jgi:GR25 family glycosyltransferase involved in LPS biosynthesis
MMESQLSKLGLPYRRIAAIEPDSPEYRLLMLEKPCKRNTATDIAVVMSHLKALYAAVHEPVATMKRNGLGDYALILEDDVKLLYDIDFRALVRRAPRRFGILQLVTSNPEAVDLLWYNLNTAQCCNVTVTYSAAGATTFDCAAELGSTLSAPLQQACADYTSVQKSCKPPAKKKKKKADAGAWNQDDYVEPPKWVAHLAASPHRAHNEYAARYWRQTNWNDLSRNGKSSLYWSAQAYIVNRRTAWKVLGDIVEALNGTANVTLLSGTAAASGAGAVGGGISTALGFKIVNSFSPGTCQRRPQRPCVLSSCLHSYGYIFSAAQPSHVSMLPLFATARLGLNTTLHPEHFAEYRKGYARVKSITADVREFKQALLPDYVRVPAAECRRPLKSAEAKFS